MSNGRERENDPIADGISPAARACSAQKKRSGNLFKRIAGASGRAEFSGVLLRREHHRSAAIEQVVQVHKVVLAERAGLAFQLQ